MNKELNELTKRDLGKGIEIEFMYGGVRGILEGFQRSISTSEDNVSVQIKLASFVTAIHTLPSDKSVVIYA